MRGAKRTGPTLSRIPRNLHSGHDTCWPLSCLASAGPKVSSKMAVTGLLVRREYQDMKFRVNYKGIQKYIGQLEMANAYLTQHWGSVSRAYEAGVKLELVL